MQYIFRHLSLCILIVMSICLNGCISETDRKSKEFYFKSIVTATYDGRVITGEAVNYQYMKYSYPNMTEGEAVILELGGGKRAYLVMTQAGSYSNLYIYAINTAFNPYEQGDSNTIYPKDTYERVLATPVGTRAKYNYRVSKPSYAPGKGYPLLIAFKNEADPTTAFIVETESPTTLFGRPFVFKGWELERVASDVPLTDQIDKYLPWVNASHPYWEGKAYNSLEQSGRTLRTEQTTAMKLSRIDFKRLKR